MNAIAPSPMSFREIVVATDLSSASANALNYARAIAKRYVSHLVLVHVSHPGSYVAIPQGGWIETGDAQSAEEEMQALGAALQSEGYAAEVIHAAGSIKDVIMSIVKAHNADLVVLGTRGKRGIERLLFGSEAEALIRHCDRPVLTVGPAAVPPPQHSELFRQIVCAATPGTHSAKATAYGYRLAQDTGADFAFFYAEDPGYTPSPDAWRAFEDALAQEMPEGEARHFPIQGHFSNESPAADIVKAARERHADLIVLGARHAIPGGTHFRRGVLPEVLLHASCPVLTINSQE